MLISQRFPQVKPLPSQRQWRSFSNVLRRSSLVIALSLLDLGRVARSLGEYAEARALYKESLAMGRVMGDHLCIAFSLEGLADVAGVQGDPVWAARL